jgi:PrcB C-terminal
VIRAAVIAVVVALAAAWVAYVHVWRYGDAHPLSYHFAKVPGFETPRAAVRVTHVGDEEHVLITSGPRSSTGYSIQVRRALVERGRISIVVRELDRPGRAKITYPYRLLVFRDLGKPVHVHWEGRS